MTQFCLIPFSSHNDIHQFDGEITRDQNIIHVHFKMLGHLSKILWPQEDNPSIRRDGLWETTCFECFISRPNSTEYLEFNFSPSLNWQCYSFLDYRQGQSTSDDLKLKQWQIDKSTNTANVHIYIECSNTEFVTNKMQINLSAVLQDENEHFHYYSLAHGSKAPDFHQAENRKIVLA